MTAFRILYFQERAAAGLAEDLRHFREVIKKPRYKLESI
jgi:hypothetical protein